MKLWLGKRNSSPEDFWKWFIANESRIRAEAGNRSILVGIAKELARVHPDLVFEYGMTSPGGDWIFEVSADGVPDRIPAVQRMVSKAPKIPGWRIVAFRQPVDLAGISLEVEGTRLELASITCQFAQTEDQRLAILLQIPLNKVISEQELMRIGFLALDSAIGEYDVMTQFAAVEFVAVTPEEQQGQPLAQLREILKLSEKEQ